MRAFPAFPVLLPGILLAILFCTTPPVHAQGLIPDPPQAVTARTSVYLEVLGNGGLYSINVDRLVGDRMALRAGIAAWQVQDLFGMGETALFTVPLVASMLFGSGNGRIEVGGGVLAGRRSFDSGYGPENNHDTFILDLTGVVGYRHQKPGGGLLFRAGLTPFFALAGGDHAYPDTGFFLSGGVSVGYSF
jgi:hypothetical protein